MDYMMQLTFLFTLIHNLTFFFALLSKIDVFLSGIDELISN